MTNITLKDIKLLTRGNILQGMIVKWQEFLSTCEVKGEASFYLLCVLVYNTQQFTDVINGEIY